MLSFALFSLLFLSVLTLLRFSVSLSVPLSVLPPEGEPEFISLFLFHIYFVSGKIERGFHFYFEGVKNQEKRTAAAAAGEVKEV